MDTRGKTAAAGGAAPPSTAELDVLIPSYRFVEYIDSGGMGAVYKAVQKSLNRTVAVKLLTRLHVEKGGFAERFKREAQALALLNHPHIISVYESGETRDGQLYYVMEFVSGMDLYHLLKREPPEPPQMMQIIMQTCEALQYAHERGIVHRDIKPANILIDDRGNVKVADFGLAKIIGPQAVDYTATGTTLGTPNYIAPEAMEYGVKVDRRVDIYSLGVVIYELLTGHLPKGQWEPPSIRSGADRRMDALVSRAMENDPDKRYQNVSEMMPALRKLLKSADNWKNYRRPSKISAIMPLRRTERTVDQDAATLPLELAKAPQERKRARVMAWAAALGLLLVAAGLAAARQAGWWPQVAQDAAHPAMAKDEPSVLASSSPAAAPQAPDITAVQEKVLRWTFEKHAFVNVFCASNTAKLVGDAADIYRFEDLPKEPFTIWRICFGAEGAKVSEEQTLEELAVMLNELGTISNVGLRGMDVPVPALRHLADIKDLVCLDLAESPAVVEEAVPYVAACKRLRLLRIGGLGGRKPEALVQLFRAALPDCQIMNN